MCFGAARVQHLRHGEGAKSFLMDHVQEVLDDLARVLTLSVRVKDDDRAVSHAPTQVPHNLRPRQSWIRISRDGIPQNETQTQVARDIDRRLVIETIRGAEEERVAAKPLVE